MSGTRVDGLPAGLLWRHETVLWRTGSAEVSDAPAGTAWPAELLVTDCRVIALAADRVDAWAYDDVTAIAHGSGEPASRFMLGESAVWIVRVEHDTADSFRAALRDVYALATSADSALGLDVAPAPIHSLARTTRPEPVETAPPTRRRVVTIPGLGDRVFHGISWTGGLSVLVIMSLVGVFLTLRGLTALKATGASFLTTAEWQPDAQNFGIAAVLTLTVLIAVVALVVAVPLAVGTGLFISEVAPRRLKQTFVSMVDLMAAVPSIVYGLWGAYFLQEHVIGLSRWISTWFGWIPIFKVDGADPSNPLASQTVYTASTFIAGLVVALMVIPISCSIMREVLSQAPAGEREGAYALGSTRWGMIRSVVLPFGRGGMIGAVMLGLGRALGETIAVYLIISPVFEINFHVLQAGSNSVASLIALRFGDASGFGLSALMAAGLALFVLTLFVNFTAAAVVSRSRSGAETDG